MTGLPRLSQRSQLIAGAVVLAALAAAVRLPGIARPLVGNFATKNAVYAMIARNWASGAAPTVHPTLDVIRGGGPSLHMVEFPVSAYLSGWLWKTCGGSLEVWGRLTSVAAIAAAVAILFLLVHRWHGPQAAWGAGLMLALSPVAIIYGQSFMLEASVVFLTLAVLGCTDRWSAGGRRWWLAAGAAAWCLLLLTKIYMLVLLLPLAAMIARSPDVGPQSKIKNQQSKILLSLLAFFLATLPAFLWYAYAYRSGLPGGPLAERLFYSVRHSAGVHHWPHPILRSPDFCRTALDNLAGVALTPLGLGLALAGLMHAQWRRHWAWLACMAALAAALPLKFHEMNYYYLVVLPPLCVLVGLGWQVIASRVQPGRFATAALLLAGVAFSLRYAARPAFVTPAEDRSVVAAAQAAGQLAAADEPIVTMHGSTIDLLYYCHRRGWAIPPGADGLATRIKECRRQGASLLVIAGSRKSIRHQDVALRRLLRQQPIRSGNGYAVYRLPPAVALAEASDPRTAAE